jgi:hypothetical protein
MPKTQVAHNALAVLKNDHQTVKELFDRFEKAKDARSKRVVAEEAISELKVHAAVEEEVFYPTVREEISDPSLISEAGEEHHVAKLLIAELEAMPDDDEEKFDAKFLVLAESVRHHIKEEEGEMFSAIKKTDIDLRALGDRIIQRKEELKVEGVPKTAEEIMVRGEEAEEESSEGEEEVP